MCKWEVKLPCAPYPVSSHQKIACLYYARCKSRMFEVTRNSKINNANWLINYGEIN